MAGPMMTPESAPTISATCWIAGALSGLSGNPDVASTSGCAPVVNRQDVGVPEIGDHLRFLLEAAKEGRIGRVVSREHLDSDVAIHARLARLVDGRETTLSQAGDDTILSELSTGQLFRCQDAVHTESGSQIVAAMCCSGRSSVVK